jgi:putative ABC transport system permease protein
VNDVAVIDGARPTKPGDVLLERTFAGRRGITPGDTISVLIDGKPTPLHVTGTAASPEYLQVTPDRYELLPAPSSFAVIFADLADLQRLTGDPATVNEVAVRLAPDAPTYVTGRIEDTLGNRGLIETTARQDQASYAALEQDLASFRAIAIAMPAIILVAGMAAVAVMLGRVVRAQRPLIGVMKALGYRDRTVLGHYLTYAAIIGAAGAAAGLAAGTLLSSAITRAYTGEIGVPYTETQFHPALAAVAAAAAVAAVTAAAWQPARRSARIPPALATRNLPGDTDRPGRTSHLERIVKPRLVNRLPLRAISRAPGRAAGTAAGIAAAIVLLLMVLGLRDAADLFLTRTFDDLERWDIAVTLDQPADPATLTSITAAPGVTDASPFLETPARLEGPGTQQDILLTALAPTQNLRLLRIGTADPASALGPGQIVLTGGLADDLGVQPGDTITARTPAGRQQLTVSATSDEPIPARAFVGLDAAARILGRPAANGFHLRSDGADPAALRARLYEQPGVAAVALRDEQRADLRSLLSVFNALIAVMLAFAVAMAFAVLFNAMTINILEREREYATMRTIGAPPRLIARFLFTETAVLWALAVIPGALLGTLIARRLGDAIGAGLFTLEVQPRAVTYLIAGGGVLTIALAAVIPPLRRLRRIDLAATTKTAG